MPPIKINSSILLSVFVFFSIITHTFHFKPSLQMDVLQLLHYGTLKYEKKKKICQKTLKVQDVDLTDYILTP